MKRARNAVAIGFVLLTAACQGSFSSGPQIPGTIPSPGGAYGASPAAAVTQSPSAPPSGSPSEAQSFLIADVAKGIPCPQSGGFTCVLHFNLPVPSPSPSGTAKEKTSASSSPSPTPTPTPTPTPSPTPAPNPKASGSPVASGAPSASPSPNGPSLSLSMTALPSDAPKMVITAKNAVPTTAVMRVTLVPSADFTLDGPASATFTLPKDQIENRGFAIQLFEETVTKKGKHEFRALFTLAKSSLSKQDLTFSFTPPKLTLPKGHKYLIVLYGDERTNTASPAPSGSPQETSAPEASGGMLPAGNPPSSDQSSQPPPKIVPSGVPPARPTPF